MTWGRGSTQSRDDRWAGQKTFSVVSKGNIHYTGSHMIHQSFGAGGMVTSPPSPSTDTYQR